MTELYKFLDYSYMMERKNEKRKRLLHSDNFIEKKIAVLCGSTFGVIKEFLELFLLYYGINPVFFVGEFNRFYEEGVFKNKELERFNPDIIFLHITNRNLLWNYDSDFNSLDKEKQRLRQLWEGLEEQYHCVIIQNNFEYFKLRMIGNAARVNEYGNVKYIDEINRFVSEYCKTSDGFYLNDINFLSSYTGLRNWFDEKIWNLYKYPMAMSEMPRYAFNIANIIKSLYGKNKKTIITDLDNTLWGGEIGEIGVDNIKLGQETAQGEAFESIHRYLKYLQLHGIVLNICSKNEYEAGIKGIRSAKSILKENDFTVKQINWKDKAENILEILEKLNLIESSAVFMDDSVVECDSVKSLLPGVETIQVEDVKGFLEELDGLSFFEITQETQEDQRRSQYYADNLKRSKEQKLYKNYDEYLKDLNMVCYVDKICDKNKERVVQLLNKTNQFNFLTKRYTLEELMKQIEIPELETYVLELEDKFGNNGIVSVAMLRIDEKNAYIYDWIMSCRVFERGLEFAMLEQICETCLKKKVNSLHGYYHETDKNIKIADFYQHVGFEQVYESQQGGGIEEWICRDINKLLKRCRNHNIKIRQKSNVDYIKNAKTEA